MRDISNRLLRCKLCGEQPRGYVTPPDESMHSGWVRAWCKCGQQMKLEPSDMPRPHFAGAMNGWDVNSMQLTAAEAEVVRRWNVLNASEASPAK
jgi:hypothetical protein